MPNGACIEKEKMKPDAGLNLEKTKCLKNEENIDWYICRTLKIDEMRK